MIFIRNMLKASLLTAGAVLTAATNLSIASAADVAATEQPPPPPGPHGPHGWHHGPWHMLEKLGLSAAQKDQIKQIMSAAKPQMQTLHEQMRANSLKLEQTQPTDPNYANIAAQVSQTHGTLSAQMMSQRAEIRGQVFRVLTPAQQTQLAALESQRQSQKRGGWGGPPPPDAQ